jgi:hypothetical protein
MLVRRNVRQDLRRPSSHHRGVAGHDRPNRLARDRF